MNGSRVIALHEIEIAIEKTELVNIEIEASFMIFTIPMCMMTLLLNMSVVKILWKKEKTIVNQLMMLDGMVNIVFASLGTFQQSPYYRGLEWLFYCYPHLMLTYASGICNRLLPVAIGVYRYHSFGVTQTLHGTS